MIINLAYSVSSGRPRSQALLSADNGLSADPMDTPSIIVFQSRALFKGIF